MNKIQHTTVALVCAITLITQMGAEHPFTPHGLSESAQGPCTAKLVVSADYCLTNDLTIDKVEIEAEGELCTNGYTLTITCDDGLTCDGILNVNDVGTVIISGGGICSVNGTLNLEGRARLIFDGADHTLSGTGQVVGVDSDASAIQISGGKMLTIDSLFTIEGRMIIDRKPVDTGVATFNNKGTVLANREGVLELASNLALADTSGGPRWKAIGFTSFSFGELKFSRAHTTICPSLTGDFLINTYGKLNFDQDIYALGNFTCAGRGTVVGTLRYKYDCDMNPPTYTVASGCP